MAGEPPLSPCPHPPSSKAAAFGIELQASPHRHCRPGRLPEPSDPPASQVQTPSSTQLPSVWAAGHLLCYESPPGHSRTQRLCLLPQSPQARNPPPPGGEPGIAGSSGIREETEAGLSPAGPRSPTWRICRRSQCRWSQCVTWGLWSPRSRVRGE